MRDRNLISKRVSMKGSLPTLNEAKTGKNYLREDELYRLHLLSEQFLLYAESTAMTGKDMTMKHLHKQLDNLLTLNGYPVFDGYKNYIRDDAKRFAENEHKLYIEIKQLEHIGVEVDLESFYLGDYDEYHEEASKVSVQALIKVLQQDENSSRIENKEEKIGISVLDHNS